MKGKNMLMSMLLITTVLSARINECNFNATEARFTGLQDFAVLRRCPSANVTSLTITNSTVPEMQKEDFYKFRNISEFKFTANHMNITNEVLRYFLNLIRLDLENNSIATVSENIFATLSKLTSLNLSNNKICCISVEAFASLTQLRTLRLRNNSINALDPGMFRNDTQLRTLDVSYNHLRELKKGVFYFSVVSNAHLFLSYNNISEIEQGTFEKCNEITALYLDHNELSLLEDGILRGLQKLSVLDVSFNRIESLSASAFTSKSKLRILRVNNNRITTFGREIVLWSYPAPVFLDLQQNPLRCICGSLSEAYEENSVLGLLTDLTCDDGRSWDVLASLNCPPSTHLEKLNESSGTTGSKLGIQTQEPTPSPPPGSTIPEDNIVTSEVTKYITTVAPSTDLSKHDLTTTYGIVPSLSESLPETPESPSLQEANLSDWMVPIFVISVTVLVAIVAFISAIVYSRRYRRNQRADTTAAPRRYMYNYAYESASITDTTES